MVTVFINEDTKEGKALLESLKYSKYATIVDQSTAIDSILKGLSELQQAKAGNLEGKSARKLADEL